MNRRKFLESTGAAVFGGVIAPIALSGDSSLAAWTQRTNVPHIVAVIFDERYHDGKIFADALVAHGARPFALHGDSAALWYGPLRTHLNSGPGRIAGLTSESDRGVSLACGRELHLKLLYEGTHDARRSAHIAHRIRAAASRDEIAASLGCSCAPWSASLADALYLAQTRNVPLAASPVAANHPVTLVTTPPSRDFPGYLTSWLLSPRASIASTL